MIWDSTYILVLTLNMTAEDCARAVMQSAGIYDVRIEM